MAEEYSDLIHDTEFHYHGQLLAAANSNKTVSVYAYTEDATNAPSLRKITDLTGHEGPVWRVAWAHPRFGTVVASASYDSKVIIWKEQRNSWKPVHVINVHGGSANAVEWAPERFGCMVASTSSDGTVALTLYNNGHWQESIRVSNNANKIAHAMGATAVSFAPYRLSMNECMLFASGGCDCKVRFWTTTVTDRGVIGAVTPTYCLEYHTGWVHDVSFCPASSSLPYLLFSSCGRDKKVCIYRKSWEQIEDDMSRGTFTEWERSEFIVDEGCWKLSWAPSSEKLLVTSSSGAVFMFTEGEDFHEKWLKVCVKE